MTRTTHVCPVCRLEHGDPKAHRVTVALVIAIVLIAVEVAVALTVDGWPVLAMWAIVAWNLLRVLLLVHGLATLAAKAGRP